MPLSISHCAFDLRAVVAGDRVPLGQQAVGHQAAHRAEADVSEVCHNAVARSQLRRDRCPSAPLPLSHGGPGGW